MQCKIPIPRSVYMVVCLGVVMAVAEVYFGAWIFPAVAEAANIKEYRDTISDSRPGAAANHTFAFTLLADVPPASQLTLTPASGFTIQASSTFTTRNVELRVNGSPRSAGPSANASTDGVTINSGSPGSIDYTLNSTTGLSAGDTIEMRVGDHTSGSLGPRQVFSSSTMSTTTLPADESGFFNPTATGSHKVRLSVAGAPKPVKADFLVIVVDPVTPSVDTTETIPPFRFNGAPTSTVGGTTLFVEISLETDEFSTCRYDTASGTPYANMRETGTGIPNTFDSDNDIIHSAEVPLEAGETNSYYVRCVDDEGNVNTTDFLIQFISNPPPSGTAAEEGAVEGDGTGDGADGTGSGDGSGGTVGEADGVADDLGGSSGGGGSGGGSGTSGEGDGGTGSGGGFESGIFPYESGDGEVIISGYSAPDSTVTFLVDGQAVARTDAGTDGAFDTTLEEIARGAYTFGIYATDPADVRSSTFSTSFTVSGARRSSLSNINLAPTILIEPDPVDPGADVTMSGYTLPDATVTLENVAASGGSATEFTASSDGDGAWSITVPTEGFSRGTYKARARAQQSEGVQIKTGFSEYTRYGVGEEADRPNNADLNTDGSVNLTDFSILLFWWNTAGGDSEPPADINQDGTVNLTDFSILLFNWTG